MSNRHVIPGFLIDGDGFEIALSQKLSEDYFLRAFLAYNNQWSIYFFNTYVALTFGDFIKENMPLCLKNPGGSLYIQRGAK